MAVEFANAAPSASARIDPHSLWFALIAPPAACVGQELASVWVSFEACHHPAAHATARLALFGLAALALVLAAGGAAIGYRSYQKLSARRGVLGAKGEPRLEMMALGALFLGVIFSLGILWEGIPTLMLLQVCEAIR